jgi:hypothetical protein
MLTILYYTLYVKGNQMKLLKDKKSKTKEVKKDVTQKELKLGKQLIKLFNNPDTNEPQAIWL